MIKGHRGFTITEILIAVVLLFLTGSLAYYLGYHAKPTSQTVVKLSPSPTRVPTLLNPASVHCKQLGGTLEAKNGATGQATICNIKGFRCEEWALFRGECRPTSKYLTGHDATGAAIPGATSELANPASTNCAKVGGKVVIQTREDGAQFGLCDFGDGLACEEWALFRGDCKKPGVKTTGFDTLAQKYCAWLGGKTTATEHATCTFSDGSVCDDDALWSGTCHKGDF